MQFTTFRRSYTIIPLFLLFVSFSSTCQLVDAQDTGSNVISSNIANDEIVLRVSVALLLGGAVGFEREINNERKGLRGLAGLRTHMLVCVGSCLIQLCSVYGYAEVIAGTNARSDPARLAAQAVSGIGFLGAGCILRAGGMALHGLTTAATLWAVMAIGLAVGIGYWWATFSSVIAILIALVIFKKIESLLQLDRTRQDLRIDLYDRPGALPSLVSFLETHDAKLESFTSTRKQIIIPEQSHVPNTPGGALLRIPSKRQYIDDIEKEESMPILNLLTVNMTLLAHEAGRHSFVNILTHMEDLDVVHGITAGHWCSDSTISEIDTHFTLPGTSNMPHSHPNAKVPTPTQHLYVQADSKTMPFSSNNVEVEHGQPMKQLKSGDGVSYGTFPSVERTDTDANENVSIPPTLVPSSSTTPSLSASIPSSVQSLIPCTHVHTTTTAPCSPSPITGHPLLPTQSQLKSEHPTEPTSM